MDVLNLLPQQYQAIALAILAVLYALTHLMAFFQPTQTVGQKITGFLNILAGNYGKAANAAVPPAPAATVTTLRFVPIAITCAIALAVTACTPAQLAQSTAAITTGCAVASAAEAAAPSFTAHNGKIVNGVAVICTDAPVAEALVAAASAGKTATTP